MPDPNRYTGRWRALFKSMLDERSVVVRQLADAIGVHPSAVHNWATQPGAPPTSHRIAQLAAALDLPPDQSVLFRNLAILGRAEPDAAELMAPFIMEGCEQRGVEPIGLEGPIMTDLAVEPPPQATLSEGGRSSCCLYRISATPPDLTLMPGDVVRVRYVGNAPVASADGRLAAMLVDGDLVLGRVSLQNGGDLVVVSHPSRPPLAAPSSQCSVVAVFEELVSRSL